MVKHWEGRLALSGVGGFGGVVVTLHLLQSGYDWREQLMSELALGAHGWAMLPAFCSLSLALLGIQHGLGRQRGGRSLRAVLVLAALSFTGAGVVTLRDNQEWHIAWISLAFVLVVLAMYLLPTQGNGVGRAYSQTISWVLGGGTALSVLAGVSGLSMGVGQRLAAVCVMVWLSYVGTQILRRE